MPPKAAPKAAPVAPKVLPGQTYTLDFLVNKLELDPENSENPEIADYNQLILQIKIGDDISFDLPINKVDGKFVKSKTSHDITVNQEKLTSLVQLPIKVELKPCPPEEKPEDKKKPIKKPDEELDKKKVKIESVAKIVEPSFGEFNIDWQLFIVQRVNDNKFTLHTQFEEKDIFKYVPPIIEPTEEEPTEQANNKNTKTPTEPENVEEIEEETPEIIGNIAVIIRLQVKPSSDRGTLADEEGILNVVDEIDDTIDPNDTIFVIGKDVAAKYEQFLVQCNDDFCPARADLNKFRSLHGRLVNTTKVFSPCGNVDCCNEYNSENEDCYCDKVISVMEKERKKNFCYRKR